MVSGRMGHFSPHISLRFSKPRVSLAPAKFPFRAHAAKTVLTETKSGRTIVIVSTAIVALTVINSGRVPLIMFPKRSKATSSFLALDREARSALQCKTFGDIGFKIQEYAESKNYSVVRDFCGHGIGQQFHTPPSVLHYGKIGEGPKLKPGMFFTIEPMINIGDWKVKILNDGWTAVTKDKSLSAQFEHTIGITQDGNEIFTLSENNTDFPINDL